METLKKLAALFVSQIASLNDVYPTVVDMAGLSIPDGLAGSSLLPLINGVGDPNRKDFITAQVPHAITLSVLSSLVRTDTGVCADTRPFCSYAFACDVCVCSITRSSV